MLGEIVSFSLVSLSAVFVVVDPFACVPFFLAMTADDSPEKRRQTAWRASAAAFGILAFFALVGAVLFRALGISLAAFRVAGGVLLLIMSIDMLRTNPSPARITEGEVAAGAIKEDIAIVPLAIPLLAGPGSIATVVVLMARARSHELWRVIPILAAILATSVASYFVLASASKVDRVLGRTGMNILSRVAGLLLAAIAIQFMIDGLADAFPALMTAT